MEAHEVEDWLRAKNLEEGFRAPDDDRRLESSVKVGKLVDVCGELLKGDPGCEEVACKVGVVSRMIDRWAKSLKEKYDGKKCAVDEAKKNEYDEVKNTEEKRFDEKEHAEKEESTRNDNDWQTRTDDNEYDANKYAEEEVSKKNNECVGQKRTEDNEYDGKKYAEEEVSDKNNECDGRASAHSVGGQGAGGEMSHEAGAV